MDHEAKRMEVDLNEKQTTIDDIFREVSRMKSVVTDAVDEGIQTALRAVKQGRDMAEDAVDDARHAIKRNPVQAAGILLAAGFILGSLVTLTLRRD
jgi:ElaB/YqjD/DUF883 family membrane-anchored ribosome-binding protein